MKQLDRREFLKTTSLAGIGTLIHANALANEFPVVRVAAGQRKFNSSVIEATISRMKGVIKDPELAWLFENCFPNTLDTTVHFKQKDGRSDTFVITGDIHAMWLRDSTAQVWPYLPLVTKDESLKQLIAGVVNRQTECILIDPYANAFNDGPGHSEWLKDHTDMKPELHERKWELDSLCYTVRLAYHYWKTAKDVSVFDEKWLKAAQLIISTCRVQQRLKGRGPYRFGRTTSWSTDTVPGNGYGNNTKPNGLIHSIFRPSDDATQYPFLIPSNLFAVVSFRQIAEIVEQVYKNQAFANECKSFANEVEQAIKKYAVIKHPQFGPMYAMEVDGFGNCLFQDDANVPNLLGLPYLGAVNANDKIYQNTRRFVLSESNPYFFKGKAAEGIGSPHTLVNQIWPMSIIMRAMTSNNDAEILAQLRFLKNTHAKTGFMHESFDKDDASKFTRKWFAWANTLFGELLLKIERERPHLLSKM
ncbi:glycoside hydrolase family 125 protein [Runella salmonicolor]|uniref:Glycoside hydrolase family 125 protein n=1 Tax=Runella salmonicolor TaxID=2950278 RepID=A0ABT1FNG7_9BACT|nr:glycoside hydrolase family 125 protein [Runella salmonicolor]MCP1383303.1 glycoside hydrolase family 125 protein [Runella salmonicolor]